MSDAVSALNGQMVAGDVTIREAGLHGMITLRGDLSLAKLKMACTRLTGVKMPGSGEAHVENGKGLCWMSPDELLILVAYDDVAKTLASLDNTLKGQHYLAENVSDARALIMVEGDFACEVIAKLAPVDLHPDTFVSGQFRRTRLGQAAAAFWMQEPDLIAVICFRSVADYVFNLLATSAKAGPVKHF